MNGSPRIARRAPGGFLPPQDSLPSPTPSTASSRAAALLPHPRSKPLVPGSKKEDYARDYVARRLLHISRRYVKKFGIPDPADEVTGYESMEDVCRDLGEVVDVLWFSGTPSLQVPYLLNVALAFNTYLPSFPPASRPTFSFLRKLDHCFASLLVGYDVKTGHPLPGFSSTVDNSPTSRFSRTDMVRCKSLADETRLLVAMVMSGEIDVVDYAEDEVVARRPARARTEARGESVEPGNPTPQSFQGIETVKAEEMEDDDDLSFSSTDDESIIPTKRKAETMTEDVIMTDDVVPSKRVKVEDEEDSTVQLSTIRATNAGPEPSAIKDSQNNEKRQFHWAVDDDDDDSDEDLPSTTASTTTEVPDTLAVGELLSSLPRPLDPSAPNADGRRMDDNDGYERGDVLEEYEEEDEEMQMNVGQVYEKTIVQLGQSLGESITDD
ncbi:hypothetical protein F5Y14DRAFT_216924 [Nemania sp. NC0429]|nr:hypothetical protein F5Y14DRAFT_216924 [Nemania sp. NC0429]